MTETNITDGAANASCLDATINGGANAGEAVQEHSGLAVGSDDYAVTPHSIPTYVAQNNEVPGVTSRINGAVLHPTGGINPTTGTGTSTAMNPAYLTSTKTSMPGRLMYNIVTSTTPDEPTQLDTQDLPGHHHAPVPGLLHTKNPPAPPKNEPENTCVSGDSVVFEWGEGNPPP